ncbi:MAG: TetR/AcrR family transcriptional regulator [Candidatus Hydrogenedentes bacterium]|nr:TetR/AcrR family transcriptional regulator [Candidatus Hydrogenedentota bacterium]
MSTADTNVESKSSRERILEVAVAMARKVGLEGLSIGALAKEVGMSKAGLFAHFGSKEELQLATFDAALARFTKRVLAPAEQTERGLPRLLQVIMDWISLTECARDQGGCFFYAVSAEFDGRPGAVRDRLVLASKQWLEWIQRQIVLAKERGHLLPDVDEIQLAFEIHAFEQQANWASQLLKQDDAFERARISVRERLRALATDKGKAILDAAVR